MMEADAPSTEVVTVRYVALCPPHRGNLWSHHRRPRATQRGRKAKAALVEDDPVPQYNAANNTSIIKAGALISPGPKEDGRGILFA